jgi:DNA-directed RNA polymerase specialized sigma24 family protein
MKEIDIDELYKLTRSCVGRSKMKVYADFEDVVQEAMMFVMKNIKYYDPKKAKLSTFVFMNVKKAMINMTVYLNAKKRSDNQFLFSLDKYVTEDHEYGDFMTTGDPENELLYNAFRDSLSPIEQSALDIIINHRWEVHYAKGFTLGQLQNARLKMFKKIKEQFLPDSVV